MSTASATLPSAVDYLGAIQHPGIVFTVPDLQRAQFEQGILGPKAATGNNAVVARATVGSKTEALRFFTRISPSDKRHYETLGSHVRKHNLVSVAAADLVPNAIKVNGGLWPVMRMEWIDGRPLDRYVRFLSEKEDKGALTTLAATWRSLVLKLQQAEFAHGDLQHGNVMIDSKSQLRLIDLDSVWIPALAGSPPSEVGHPNYQHPARQTSAHWGRWVDTFSALVIYISLRALAVQPSLWGQLNDDDNLIFRARDFLGPLDTPVWKKLSQLGNAEIDKLCEIFKKCCLKGTVNQSLEQVLSGQAVVTPSAGSPNGTPTHQAPIGAAWWEGRGPNESALSHRTNNEPLAKRVAGVPWPIAPSAVSLSAALPPPPPASSETRTLRNTSTVATSATKQTDSEGWWTRATNTPTQQPVKGGAKPQTAASTNKVVHTTKPSATRGTRNAGVKNTQPSNTPKSPATNASGMRNGYYQVRNAAWFKWILIIGISSIVSWTLFWSNRSLRPNAPSNVRISRSSPTSATIAWNDNSANELGFVVVLFRDNTEVARRDVGAESISYTWAGLEGISPTCFDVIAYNESGGKSSTTNPIPCV